MDVVITLLVVIVLIYCLASHVLRKYPEILHDCKPPRFTAVHISHRGGAGEHLENTMTAFNECARNCNTDMFELDCHMTSDGHVVVAHDSNLLRMCAADIFISRTALANLPLLLSTQRLDFDHSITVKGEDRKLILLEHLFMRYPNMPMNIDIKADNHELMHKVHALIVKFEREHITVWGSGNNKINKQVKAISSKIGTLFSLTDVIKTTLLYYTGLLPFLSLYGKFYEIPMLSVILNRPLSFSLGTKRWWIRLAMFFADKLLMNKKLFQHLKRRGVPVYIFVLNTEEEWETACSYGVSGIMTDFPTRLRKWLTDHPLIEADMKKLS